MDGRLAAGVLHAWRLNTVNGANEVERTAYLIEIQLHDLPAYARTGETDGAPEVTSVGQVDVHHDGGGQMLRTNAATLWA